MPATRGLPAGRSLQRHALCAYSKPRQNAQQEGPDISLLSPALQEKWDHAANAHLRNIFIKPQSHKKVSWKCDACPDGHPHQWLATVSIRTNGSGCPQCSSRKLCKHNWLATIAPWAAAQWDYQVNAALGTPDSILAQSHQPVGWHCQVCGHRWTVLSHSRVSWQSGCPQCVRTGPPTKRPTFAESQHPLLKEWDHDRNGACGHFPENIRLRSNKLVFWLCNKCPAGQEHSWSAPPSSRTDRKQAGCPICAGRVACKCNSLLAIYSDIAAEWDYAKNTGQPCDYTAGSSFLAWWHNPQRGSWQQTIMSRTSNVIRYSARQRRIQQ